MRDMSTSAPFARGNEASRQAAEAIGHQLTGIRGKVFDHIVSRATFGATCDEISRATGQLRENVRPRCSELKDAGFIKDSGELRKNVNNGKDETVWVALPDWPTGPWIAPEKRDVDYDAPSGLAVFDDVLRRNPHLKNTIGHSNIVIIRGDLAIVAGCADE